LNAYGQANAAYGAANNRVLKAGDTMTGQLNISSGGLLVTGNVGIGTASPSNAQLVVKAASAYTANTYFATRLQAANYSDSGGYTTMLGFGVESAGWSKGAIGFTRTGSYDTGYLAFYLNNTADSSMVALANERARITSDGNVGIGTSSPTEKLDVAGNIAITGTGALSLQRALIPSGADSGTPQLAFKFYSTGTTYTVGAQIQALSAAAWSSTSAPTNLIFYTCPSGSTTLSERLRIDSAGNLGIGTSNPGSKLHILDSSGPVLRMVRTSNRFDIEADNNAMGLVSRDSGTASAYFSGFSGVGIGTTQPAALLHVGNASSAAELLRLHVSYDTSRNIRGGLTWHDGGNVTGRIATEYDGSMVSMRFTSLYSGGYNSNDLMIIRGNGNVGIGTASPSANLHVQTSSNRHILIKSASHSTLSTDIGSAITFSRPSDGSADMAGIFSWNNGGLVFSSRNEIVFATGGTSSYSNAIEAMRITRSDSSPGNVGIGTSNPNAKLHVFGGTFTFEPAAGRYIYSNVDGSGHFIEQIGTTAAERILRIQNSNGGGTYTQLFLDGANQRIYTSTNVNVGIGTAAPDQKLRVVAASATSNADVINLDGGSTDFSGPNDANTAYSLIFNACAYSISSGVVQRTGASVTMAKETSWNEAVAGAGTKGALVFKTNSGTIASPSLLERMRISSGGIVTTPYQPSFSAYLNTGYTHPSGVVGAIGGTWATHHNTGSHYSTSTRRFTAPIAGTYQFHCIIATEGGSGSFNYLSAELWVNGNRTRIGGWGCGGAGGSYGETASSYVVYMNAGDYAEMGCESNKSFNAQTGSNTLFAGYLIG
jgi:hypothetical protein